MSAEVDSYRFTSRVTERIARAWIMRETDPTRPFPWTPFTKPLSESTIALISSAGVALKGDRPFDQAGERRNPWRGDSSFRVVNREATTGDVTITHLHINPRYAGQDLNVLFPLERLAELATRGEIGRAADAHYSIMGYILDAADLLRDTVPQIAAGLRAGQVDGVVLVPA
jgi:D-proline reductase (dithiol) PrdB